MELRPLTPALGALVRGVDPSDPTLDAAAVDALRSALHEHGLLLFRGVDLDEDQQVAFSRHFGRVSLQGAVQKTSDTATYVSNVRADGTFGEGPLAFHSDQCYFAHPIAALLLYGVEVPTEGGQTLFASTTRAARRLPPELRARVEGLSVRHFFDYGARSFGAAKRAEVEAVVVRHTHPVISTHPDTGEELLLVNLETLDCLVGPDGIDLKPADSNALAAEIVEEITAPDNVYTHTWRERDLIVWDNLALQHARTEFDEVTQRRTLRRVAIAHRDEPVPA